MTPEIKKLLLKYDEIGVYEFPSNFNYDELERLAYLVDREIQTLGSKTTFEDATFNQDASFSVAIILDDFKIINKNGHILPTIRFSNFGNMVTVTYTDEIPATLLSQIIEILTKHKFQYIPADQLDVPYDGVMEDKKSFYSWWIRYFDWI